MLRHALLVLMLAGAAALPAFAEETARATDAEKDEESKGEDAEGEAIAGAIYIPLRPPFVVNYGGVGRLRYLKADISLRVQDAKTEESVRHHMPYIRNNLVMLFAAQTEESIGSQEGKEALRQEALQEVREVILAEDGQEGVIDLYFTTFLIQK